MAHAAFGESVQARHGIRDYLMMCFFKCIPKHVQQLFYIVSLAGQFDRYATCRLMALSRLNEVMHLAYRKDAVKLPLAMSELAWGKTRLQEILTVASLKACADEHDLRQLAGRVISISPSWMRYAGKQVMIGDVARMLHYQRSAAFA